MKENEVCKMLNDKIEEIVEKVEQVKKDLDGLKLREEHDYGNDVGKLNRIIDEQLLQLGDLKRQNAVLKAELEKTLKQC